MPDFKLSGGVPPQASPPISNGGTFRTRDLSVPLSSAPPVSPPTSPSAPMSAVAPLSRIGNYDVLEKIGEGGAGLVYKARDWQTNAVVALKVISAAALRNPVLFKRFQRECQLATKVSHPNLVRTYAFSVFDGTPVLIMEYIDGKPVCGLIEQKGRLPEEEAIDIICQVCKGLQYAHSKGLIHRDIKPDNILVTRTGVVKLADLGLAKDISSTAELTRTGGGLGTPNFMAPEQFRDAKNASICCDIYSLGATLYEMVTGELPFGRDNPLKLMKRKLANDLPPVRKFVPGISQHTERVICRAMSTHPRDRQKSCAEFVAELSSRSQVPSGQAMQGPLHGKHPGTAGPRGNSSPKPAEAGPKVGHLQENLPRARQEGRKVCRRSSRQAIVGELRAEQKKSKEERSHPRNSTTGLDVWSVLLLLATALLSLILGMFVLSL